MQFRLLADAGRRQSGPGGGDGVRGGASGSREGGGSGGVSEWAPGGLSPAEPPSDGGAVSKSRL